MSPFLIVSRNLYWSRGRYCSWRVQLLPAPISGGNTQFCLKKRQKIKYFPKNHFVLTLIDKKLHFFVWRVQLLPEFHLAGPIVARTFVRWKRNFIYPCTDQWKFLKNGQILLMILAILQPFALCRDKSEWKCQLKKEEFLPFSKKWRKIMLKRGNCDLWNYCRDTPHAVLR